MKLIIEKCTNFHENQLQKRRRLTAKQLDTQLQQEVESADATHAMPARDVDSGIVEDMDPNTQQSTSRKPSFDKSRFFQEQFSAYTLPVPAHSVPNGLPLVSGVPVQPINAESAHERSSTSLKRLPDPATSYDGPSKRSRLSGEHEISHSPSHSHSHPHNVTLRVGSKALAQLEESGKVSASGPSFTSINPLTTSAIEDESADDDTIHVKPGKGSISALRGSGSYVSPYRQRLPYGEGEAPGSGPHNRRKSSVSALLRDSRSTSISASNPQRPMEEQQRPASLGPALPVTTNSQTPPTAIRTTSPDIRKSLAFEILGSLAFSPVAKGILKDCPDLTRDKLQNLKTIFEEYPQTQTDFSMLDKSMQGFSNESLPGRPSSEQSKPPLRWAHTSLPDCMTTGAHAPQRRPSQAAAPLEPPHAQKPMPAAIMSFEEFQKHNPLPRATHSVQREATLPSNRALTPKREPVEIKTQQVSPSVDSKVPLHSRSLENVEVEIEWGRGMEFSDYMELKDFNSVQELFDMIDSYRPDELSQERIKEVRVKSKKELVGGNVLPRIVKDEVRGRPAIRHLLKKMRSQPEEQEIELVFSVLWQTAIPTPVPTTATGV